MYTLDVKVVQQLLDRTIPSFQATCVETMNLGFGHLFYGFARALRPKRVVVIGSKAGFAPICFARALADNEGSGIANVEFQATKLVEPDGQSHLDFVDPSYSVGRENEGWHSFGEGHWDDPQRVAELWRSFDVEAFVTHYKMTSAQYLEATRGQVIDLLYVDGDHRYEGIMHDLVEFRSRLSPDALVLAHDVDPALPPEESEGYRVLNDLPPDLYEFVRIPVYPGLAILRPR